MIECTYLYEKEEKLALRNNHICWTDLKPFVLSHPDQFFVLFHFSLKYKNEEILNFFELESLKHKITK